MTADLNALGNLAGNVSKTIKPHKLNISKKTKQKLDEKTKRKPVPEAKTPSAADVRAALSEGEITPLEAADLNPKGGLKPKASDVRAAYKGGHITAEEATDLNYNVNLNTGSSSGAKSKSSGASTTTGPIKVSSERVYSTSEGMQPRPAIGSGRQWDNV